MYDGCGPGPLGGMLVLSSLVNSGSSGEPMHFHSLARMISV